MAILIDSSVLCAYANIRDVHHKKSVKIIEDIISGKYGDGILTDYVFDETITVVLRKTNKNAAQDFGEHILNSQLRIAMVGEIIFQKAWQIFGQNNVSFTDCTMVSFMETFGINKIATFDKEFRNFKKLEVIDN